MTLHAPVPPVPAQGPAAPVFPAPTPALILVLAALLLLLTACDRKAEQPMGMPPVPATLAKAESRDAPLFIPATGHVQAYNSVSLRPQVTAVLEKVHFANGQEVQKGDLLFTLDQRPFQLALNKALANLSGNRAKASQAQRDSARYQNLAGSGAVSRDDFEQKATTQASTASDATANQAAADIARQDLSYCTIRAPFSGRMGARLKDEGNLAVANQDVLAVINQIEPIRVVFSVPEKYLPAIRERQDAAALRARAAAPGLPGEEWGTVTMYDNTVDQDTGMVNVEARFENRERRLWPGQYVNVDLELALETGRVVVPARAVTRGPDGSLVFVAKADNTVQVRPVTKGRRLGDDVIIEQGLAAGETVVTDGQLGLYPGATVIPATSPDEARAAAPQG